MSQSCQIVTTSGTSIGGSVWPTTPTGYSCPSCGLWVQYGIYHNCSTWKPITTWTWPTIQNWSSMPSITAFKGAVKALKDLPAKAAHGDAYYVTSEDTLAVRQNGGWFHFDKK